MRTFLYFVLMCTCCAAYARMYQWNNPATGRAELSGSPPAWYRSGSGPRVRVYENGNIIDDTAITLSPEHERILREAAFSEFQERSERAAVARLERLAARQAAAAARPTQAESSQSRSAEPATGETAPVRTVQPRETEANAEEGELATAIDSTLIEQFKELVREFDAQLQGVSPPQRQ